ncbi:MAG: hypothetical protein ACR2L2_12895, partial [Acidobacteriota bacterium]
MDVNDRPGVRGQGVIVVVDVLVDMLVLVDVNWYVLSATRLRWTKSECRTVRSSASARINTRATSNSAASDDGFASRSRLRGPAPCGRGTEHS